MIIILILESQRTCYLFLFNLLDKNHNTLNLCILVWANRNLNSCVDYLQGRNYPQIPLKHERFGEDKGSFLFVFYLPRHSAEAVITVGIRCWGLIMEGIFDRCLGVTSSSSYCLTHGLPVIIRPRSEYWWHFNYDRWSPGYFRSPSNCQCPQKRKDTLLS